MGNLKRMEKEINNYRNLDNQFKEAERQNSAMSK